MPKSYVLFAGVNGAGKTTLYQANPHLRSMPRINLDEIVRSVGTSFNQETTLCGKTIIRYIQHAREEGFEIELHYVGLDSPEIAKERIRQRVRDGGHGVPDGDIDRRYLESLKRLKDMPTLCDRIYIYDNTNRFVKIAGLRNGKWRILVKELPEWVKNQAYCRRYKTLRLQV